MLPAVSLPPGVSEELARTAGRILDARHFLGRAIEALAEGDAARAVAEAAAAKQAAPRAPTVREMLGVAQYAAGDFKAALSELQAFRRMSGSQVRDAHIADCYRATGRPERAVEFLEGAEPANAALRRLIALVRASTLSDHGDANGAAAALRLAGIPDEPLRPVGSLRPGSVGSSARTRPPTTGTRSTRRSER